MLFLLAESPQKLKLRNIYGTLIILISVSPSFPQLPRLFFYLKHEKRTSSQRVSGGETPNLILKRMLQLFPKIPPLMKILEL